MKNSYRNTYLYEMEYKILYPQDYPERLREIPDVPEKLYLLGQMPPAEAKMLCIVGARNHTEYGKDVCEKLIRGLAGKNICIVSGLAMGIDAIAHKTALEVGLHTLAIPGSGLGDKALHPQSNLKLAKKIIEQGGGMISEYEPDFKATIYSFPQRNRIMAGISEAILIIEAEMKSGTLITSKLATDYNRDVLAVPGSIFSKNSFGPHMLIRLGATPVTCTEDLLQALGFDTQEKLLVDAYDTCTPLEKKILELLDEPKARDEIIDNLGMHTSEINIALSLLEMKGFVKETLGEFRKII